MSAQELVDLHIGLLVHFWIIFNQEYEKMPDEEWTSNNVNTTIQNENLWSVSLLNQIIRNGDDDLAWIILNQLWQNINPTEEKVRVMFGVGPMEDLMRHFSEKYIDDVITWARSDEHFKRTLLEDVWGKQDWTENAKAKMKIYFEECCPSG